MVLSSSLKSDVLLLNNHQLTVDSYKPDLPTPKPKIGDLSDLKTKETFPLLVRASDGDKLKISTIVTKDDMESFFGNYGEVCKNGMQGLKKRDRKKEKAKKEKKKEKK
jgi:signal recognition particle subunit SRP14